MTASKIGWIFVWTLLVLFALLVFGVLGINIAGKVMYNTECKDLGWEMGSLKLVRGRLVPYCHQELAAPLVELQEVRDGK